MAKKAKSASPKLTSGSSPSDVLERSPIHLLHRASQCAGNIFQAEMGTEDLTPRQYALLVAIAQNEGLSQTDLVQRTGIDRSTLADVIRRMLKKGLVQRRRTREDARAYAVKLTELGRRSLQACEPLARRVDQRILTALPNQEQRERFIADLLTIVSALGSMETTMIAEAPKGKRKT
ncbi:Transcriptional regulator, MarR family [Candidatus Filomicrobium marinum]|nr:MarR family transcriptional regulator [Candidatus Filomicrobium marinum]MCV0370637.1 MarR family transcriptional regulator [Filomicrobium sp.]CFX07477.1 Transcriptional regulator, MarR family [Candidatus Filomicrobium marinum]SDP58299.1 transcriptional regulator, MarR family [Filomicrobium insigne]